VTANTSWTTRSPGYAANATLPDLHSRRVGKGNALDGTFFDKFRYAL
jgi:hypothetical protein